MKKFYRVGHQDTKQGLWYTQAGNFTGLIHDKLSFCTNSALVMPFDENIVGWLSATETLEELYTWFPVEDLVMLANHGFIVMKYVATDYKKHQNHWVINQATSRLVTSPVLDSELNNPLTSIK